MFSDPPVYEGGVVHVEIFGHPILSQDIYMCLHAWAVPALVMLTWIIYIQFNDNTRKNKKVFKFEWQIKLKMFPFLYFTDNWGGSQTCDAAQQVCVGSTSFHKL